MISILKTHRAPLLLFVLLFLGLVSLESSVWGLDGLSLWAPVLAEYLRGHYEDSKVIFGGQNLLALYGDLPFWGLARFLDASVFQTLNLTYLVFLIGLYTFTQTIYTGLSGIQSSASRTLIFIYCLLSPVILNRVYAGRFNLLFGMLPLLIAVALIYCRNLWMCFASIFFLSCSLRIQSYQILIYHVFYLPLFVYWLWIERSNLARDYFFKLIGIILASISFSWHPLWSMATHAQDPANLRHGYSQIVYSYLVGSLSDLGSLFISSVNPWSSRSNFFFFHEINYPTGFSFFAVFFLPSRFKKIFIGLMLSLAFVIAFASRVSGIDWIAGLPLIELFRVPERAYLLLCYLAPLFLFTAIKPFISASFIGCLFLMIALGNGVPGFELVAILGFALLYFSRKHQQYPGLSASLLAVSLFFGLPEKFVQIRDSNQSFKEAVQKVKNGLATETEPLSSLRAHFTGPNALMNTLAGNYLGIASFEGYGHPPKDHVDLLQKFIPVPQDPMANVLLINSFSKAPLFKDALVAAGINRVFVEDPAGNVKSFKFP